MFKVLFLINHILYASVMVNDKIVDELIKVCQIDNKQQNEYLKIDCIDFMVNCSINAKEKEGIKNSIERCKKDFNKGSRYEENN
jgi:hypothetical protein